MSKEGMKERLKVLQEESGLKGARIAAMVGRDRQWWYDLMNGRITVQSKDLPVLAEVLKTTEKYLLTGKDTAVPPASSTEKESHPPASPSLVDIENRLLKLSNQLYESVADLKREIQDLRTTIDTGKEQLLKEAKENRVYLDFAKKNLEKSVGQESRGIDRNEKGMQSKGGRGGKADE